MMGNPENKIATRDEIALALRNAGIHAGDVLALHSSLKSLGRVDGGAEAVIGAFQDVLTPDGALLMPTHTYSLPMWQKPPFNVRESPSLVGKITDVFWRMPGVIRSEHPTHSVAVWGKMAHDLTKDVLSYPPAGIGSSWYRFYLAGGRILMLGTNQEANTTLHLCETLAGVSYINVAFTPGQDYEIAHRINEQGEAEKYILRGVPGCSRGFRKCEPFLREKGVLKDVLILSAESQLLDAQSLVSAMVEKLKEDPAFILCDLPDCGICPRRRRSIY